MGVESIKMLPNYQSICQRVQWSQDIKRHLLDATNAFSKLCGVQSLCRINGLPYSILTWNKQPIISHYFTSLCVKYIYIYILACCFRACHLCGKRASPIELKLAPFFMMMMMMREAVPHLMK